MCQLHYWENRYVSLLHLRREAGWRMCFAVFHYKRSHGPGNTKENGLDDPVCLTVEFLIYFYTKIKSPSRFLTRYLTFYPIVKARLYWYLLTYNISTKQWIRKYFTTLQACYCTIVNQWSSETFENIPEIYVWISSLVVCCSCPDVIRLSYYLEILLTHLDTIQSPLIKTSLILFFFYRKTKQGDGIQTHPYTCCSQLGHNTRLIL